MGWPDTCLFGEYPLSDVPFLGKNPMALPILTEAMPSLNETIVLNAYFLEGEECPPRFRGAGRFKREMREAGFGRFEFSYEFQAVEAITAFTRESKISDYLIKTVAKDAMHPIKVRCGFELIGADDFLKLIDLLLSVMPRLGTGRELIKNVKASQRVFAKFDQVIERSDWDGLTTKRAAWMRNQPYISVVSAEHYRRAFIQHCNMLRAAG